MNEDAFKARQKSLEDSFFSETDSRLMLNLKEELKREQQREQLCVSCGIKDRSVIDCMVETGIDVEHIAALALAPLVLVAWADGVMQVSERDAILKAAHDDGLEAGNVARQLLESWLQSPPPETLKAAWMGYVHEVAKKMPPPARAAFKNELMGRARNVAKVCGGVLGIGSVSSAEKQMLDELETAFPS